MKKRVFALFVSALAAVSFVACGDDSSSSNASNEPGKVQPSALPDTVQTLDSLLNEYKCRESYKCAHVYLVEMSNMMECDGEAWVYLSDYLPSACGYEPGEAEDKPANGETENPATDAADETEGTLNGGVEGPEEKCYEGDASITISNVENLNMACGTSSEGMTIYDEDTFILHTCKGGEWQKEELFPCDLTLASVKN